MSSRTEMQLNWVWSIRRFYLGVKRATKVDEQPGNNHGQTPPQKSKKLCLDIHMFVKSVHPTCYSTWYPQKNASNLNIIYSAIHMTETIGYYPGFYAHLRDYKIKQMVDFSEIGSNSTKTSLNRPFNFHLNEL